MSFVYGFPVIFPRLVPRQTVQGLTGHTHLFHAVLDEMELTCDAWSGPARAALSATTDASAHYVREDPSHAFSMCAELVKLAQTLLASVRAGVHHGTDFGARGCGARMYHQRESLCTG